jgi:flagellar secretion chaperone FliS
MYGHSSPFAARHQRPNHAYSRVGLETEVHDASPHRLIAMLFDGLFANLAAAEGAMAAGNRELKTQALMRAVRILDEGLKAGLNLEQGGAIALQLHGVYSFCTVRVTHANLRDDVEALREVRRILEPVREAWGQIAPAAEHPAAA